MRDPDVDTAKIPGLAHLTGPPAIDGRVKVLWLEDKTTIEVSVPLEPFVQVTRLLVPESAQALLGAERTRVTERMRAARYELTECPHDIYIADHRLDEAATNEVGEPTLARHAEASGLTTSVMMALSFPAHPATIIPYTAYQDQIKYQRDLLKRLCPDYVNVCWGDEPGKLELVVGQVLLDALRAHREFLVVAAHRGLIHLRSRERERVRAEFYEPNAEQKVWPGHRFICLETEWGPRDLLLGALWPEAVLDEAPPDEKRRSDVVKWLDRFPTPTQEEQAARDLADRYFWLSVFWKSEARYRLAHDLRAGITPGAEAAENLYVRDLCKCIGLDPSLVRTYVEALRDGRQPPEVRIPAGWQVPHLLNAATKEGLEKPVKRLAVFCLLVYEEAGRWAFREETFDQIPESTKELLRVWGRTYRISESKLIDGVAQLIVDYLSKEGPEADEILGAFTRLLNVNGIDSTEAMEGLLGLLRRWRGINEVWPLTVDLIPRLIDPLPEQFDTADRDVAGDRVGQRLASIGFTSLTKLLTPGNGGQVTLAERLVFQRFALDLGFPRTNWPGWMG